MKKNKIALITGVTGQDGSLLAKFLLKKNYIVHGIKRKSSSFNTSRIDHVFNGPSYVNISNCMITNNSANTGGGIYTYESFGTISYTEITNNYASNDGGGVTCSQSFPYIINVTLSNNSAPNGNDLLVAWSSNISILNTIVWSPIGTIGSPTITVDYSHF